MSARRRARAYIGLGVNLGDAAATLAGAVTSLEALQGVRVDAVSRLYATAPRGVPDRPDARNAVVGRDVTRRSSDPEAAALELLASLKRIERQAGRQVRTRWGPREPAPDPPLSGRHPTAAGRAPAPTA